MQVATPLEGGSTKVNITTVENNNGLLSSAINTLTSALNKVKEIAEKVKQANNTTSSSSSNSSSTSSSSSGNSGVSTSLSTSSTRSSSSSSLRNRNSSSSTTQNSSGLRNRNSSSSSSGTSTSALSQIGFDEAKEKVLNALNDTKKLLDVGKKASDEYKKAEEEVKNDIEVKIPSVSNLWINPLQSVFPKIGEAVSNMIKGFEESTETMREYAKYGYRESGTTITYGEAKKWKSDVENAKKLLFAGDAVWESMSDVDGTPLDNYAYDYIYLKDSRGAVTAAKYYNGVRNSYVDGYYREYSSQINVPVSKDVDYDKADIDINNAANYNIGVKNYNINGHDYNFALVLPNDATNFEQLYYNICECNVLGTISSMPPVMINAGASGSSNYVTITTDPNAMNYKGDYGGYYLDFSNGSSKNSKNMVVINANEGFTIGSAATTDNVLHEFAHKFDDMIQNGNVETGTRKNFFTEDSTKWNEYYQKCKDDITEIHFSGYSKEGLPDVQEFFAESVTAYLLKPDELKLTSMELYDSISNLLGSDYGGSVTTSSNEKVTKYIYVQAINNTNNSSNETKASEANVNVLGDTTSNDKLQDSIESPIGIDDTNDVKNAKTNKYIYVQATNNTNNSSNETKASETNVNVSEENVVHDELKDSIASPKSIDETIKTKDLKETKYTFAQTINNTNNSNNNGQNNLKNYNRDAQINYSSRVSQDISDNMKYTYSNYDKISLVNENEIMEFSDTVYDKIQQGTIDNYLKNARFIDKNIWNALLIKYNGVLPSGATYKKFESEKEFFKQMMKMYLQRHDDLKDLYPEIYEQFKNLLGNNYDSAYINKA